MRREVWIIVDGIRLSAPWGLYPAAGRMRIAVDARTVYSSHRRGTGKNLVDVYSTLAREQTGWEFLMFCQQATDDDPFRDLRNVRREIVDIPGDRWNLWEEVRLPLAARRRNVDVLHCPANTAPVQPLVPMLLTIHDLIPIERAPDSPAAAKWLRRLRRAASKARRIITPSHFTRHELARVAPESAGKTAVNYWAPDKECRRVESRAIVDGTRRKFGVPENARYVLAFGAGDPRKNTEGIIRAWACLDRSDRANAVLVIVGLQPAALNKFAAVARTVLDDDSVRLHGFADGGDIAPLLTGAAALCYPSYSEGFGLPILDAFACGAPVITSNRTSLPEVAGDAALLVDPDRPDEIAGALRTLLRSAEVAQRLAAAGAQRVREFSWERCAETLALNLQKAAA